MPEHKKAFENEARKNIVYTRIYASNKFADWLLARRILQENMRSTAFFKLYKICILLHRCNLKIFAKNRFEKTAIFVKFQQKIANVAKFAKFCQISKISAWESGRFWKMLQNAYFLAKIGADTAENEQHFAEILPTDALWRRANPAPQSAAASGASAMLRMRCHQQIVSLRVRRPRAFIKNVSTFVIDLQKEVGLGTSICKDALSMLRLRFTTNSKPTYPHTK